MTQKCATILASHNDRGDLQIGNIVEITTKYNYESELRILNNDMTIEQMMAN